MMLFLEDDPEFLKAYKIICKDANGLFTSKIEDAERLLLEYGDKIKVLFTDLSLNGEFPLDLIDKALEKNIDIIVVSGYIPDDNFLQIARIPFNSFVTKNELFRKKILKLIDLYK